MNVVNILEELVQAISDLNYAVYSRSITSQSEAQAIQDRLNQIHNHIEKLKDSP